MSRPFGGHGLSELQVADFTAIGASGVRRHFDICRDCAHLTGDSGESEAAPSRLACGLLKFPVDNDTTKLLCANFRPAAE